jgi:hypothetical protein
MSGMSDTPEVARDDINAAHVPIRPFNFKLEVSIRYRLWNGALVASMLGIVWIGFVGKLISFKNY